MNDSITVVIPTIPVRRTFFNQAVSSVLEQTLSADALAVSWDTERLGAARNRQRALETARTKWVAFLDDDDRFYPQHLDRMLTAALEQDADYVFSWYDVEGGSDPRPQEFGLEWDPENPRQTTVVTFVKTELAQSVGFVHPDETKESLNSPDRHYAGEDWFFTRGCWQAGAKIYHLPEKTWVWRHHGHNTSGLPTRW
jgi:glycosyltransferase involved in cell wall biosynthesis